MNNTQLYLSIGLPMMVFILTWLANRAEMNRHIDRIDRTIEGMRSEVRGDLDGLRTEVRGDLNRETSSVRAEIAAMREDHHKDFVALMSYMVPLHERMTKLESQK